MTGSGAAAGGACCAAGAAGAALLAAGSAATAARHARAAMVKVRIRLTRVSLFHGRRRPPYGVRPFYYVM
jgi:hypothetical protein